MKSHPPKKTKMSTNTPPCDHSNHLSSSHSTRWIPGHLLSLARKRLCKMKVAHRHDRPESTWWAMRPKMDQVRTAITQFLAGEYRFSPMRQYRFKKETIRVWNYLDRIVLHLLHRILRPTFRHIIPSNCYHLQGPGGVKPAVDSVNRALKTGEYRYMIRGDIKSYYASVDHRILCRQIDAAFQDPAIRHYLKEVITAAIDKDGDVVLPERGLPRRSSLSPFFGALYLAPLARAFENRKGVFFSLYMDDWILLCKTKRQYQKAKKLMYSILDDLKLKLSPSKSKMGRLSRFHYLGAQFEVPQSTEIKKTQLEMHVRSCNCFLNPVSEFELYRNAHILMQFS